MSSVVAFLSTPSTAYSDSPDVERVLCLWWSMASLSFSLSESFSHSLPHSVNLSPDIQKETQGKKRWADELEAFTLRSSFLSVKVSCTCSLTYCQNIPTLKVHFKRPLLQLNQVPKCATSHLVPTGTGYLSCPLGLLAVSSLAFPFACVLCDKTTAECLLT